MTNNLFGGDKTEEAKQRIGESELGDFQSTIWRIKKKRKEKSNHADRIATSKPRSSPEAQAVLDSGRELFRLYHRQDAINVNVSFYDIRRYFQGIDANGRMNAVGADPEYNAGVARLREAMKRLEERIAPKVYRYGFLLE